jgi:hypothetical protein
MAGLKLAADAVLAKFATIVLEPASAPVKPPRKPPREYRHLEPPLSPTGIRIFVAADLEFTFEFQWCERTIRERFRDVPGVDDPPRLDYNSVRIPEPVAYEAWQQREQQRLKQQKRLDQQRPKRRKN